MQPPAERRLGARLSDFEDRYISVGGVRTRYWQAGSEGSPVILLHGIGCSAFEWHANITALAARHRVYAVDFLGYGLTEKPSEETYTVPRLAQFVLDFLSANAIHRAHFAGFSLGGRIALECALVAPERVSSMMLVAPAGMARDGTLIHLRLASVPLLGEMLIRPTPPNTKTVWRLAFWDPSFVTAEFVAAKLNLARLPGAKAAFLKNAAQRFDLARLAGLPCERPACRAPDGACADTCHLGQARQVSFGRACRGSAMFAPKHADSDI